MKLVLSGSFARNKKKKRGIVISYTRLVLSKVLLLCYLIFTNKLDVCYFSSLRVKFSRNLT